MPSSSCLSWNKHYVPPTLVRYGCYCYDESFVYSDTLNTSQYNLCAIEVTKRNSGFSLFTLSMMGKGVGISMTGSLCLAMCVYLYDQLFCQRRFSLANLCLP